MAQAARRNERNNDTGKDLVVQPPRLPMPAEAAPEGVSPGEWKALVDAVFPSAKTVDGVMLAIRYCKARKLDIFKRCVHVVPMWNSALGREVETVWPGIADYRTTASRTGMWAGNDQCVFGPTLKEGFKDRQVGRGQNAQVREAECAPFDFPEWAQVTVYKIMAGQRVAFVGPKVYFKEIFSGEKGLRVPNAKWRQSPIGMIEKCAEAAALRRAFPEEIGSDYTAEEMEGKVYGGDTVEASRERHAAPIPEETKPTRESTRGWSDEIQEEIDAIQGMIDDPGSALVGLQRGKQHYLKEYADWPEAALKELGCRFDTAIIKLGGEVEPQNQEEEDNEQETD
jgi:phage recombination protein Bet